ncbi:MAG: hypothetical protein J6583_10875 [Gilliamella sp.]|uniref:TadE/TadG family type IV pilus assembly protein n=1 Tax=Gilliamella sp. TaxID=1891236 RepID=UPI0025FBA398|nr:hypothetical protein [Gilliamella sp.]MCO6544836.1 hypothetical protein [Gilliamella sp.]MCO6548264.1 hypothetical protein [Gilliamella sp.]
MCNIKANQNNKKSFFKCTSGSIVLSLAIMLPAMFLCMVVSIDHTQTMRNRARVSEATNEASLAIVALNNKNVDQSAIEQNRKMALNYINYFINHKISDDFIEGIDATIDVEYEKNKRVYSIVYKQKFDSLISGKEDGKADESNQSILVSNKTESYGNTKKFNRIETVDIAFISDFSGSATCLYNDYNCNRYSQQNGNAGKERLHYMKTAIANIINKFKQYPEYKFALVPYDIGVPVQNKTKNLAGGESYSCSIMYKLKSPYDVVDYNFWANKNIAYQKWSKLKENGIIQDYLKYDYLGNFEDTVYYNLDYFYYRYYSQILGPALGLHTNEALVDKGLCRLQNSTESLNNGTAKYACDLKDPDDYPLNKKNKSIIKSQYAKIVEQYDHMFSDAHPNVHYSFANTETVDVQGTINTLFSGMKTNIITFNRPISPTVADFSPFQGMCQSPLYNNGIMNEEIINMQSSFERFAEAAKNLKSFKLSPRLIPFSDDIEHNSKILDYIKKANWRPGGGTDTITALLRTVPVIAKSNAARNKIMIIITDGKDDTGADLLRDQFLENGVCQAITSGLTSSDNKEKGYIDEVASNAVIHYVKLSPKAANLKTDDEYKKVYGKWFTNCMKGNKQYLHEAQDYQTLYDALTRIIQTETGKFINKSESE